MSSTPLLSIKGLSIAYATSRGPRRVLRDIDFSIAKGETLAMVGESGSGKSTVAAAVMGLLGTGATIETGEITFEGKSLQGLSESDWRSLRGRRISLVFQDPFTSLNPALTIGDQIADSLTHTPGLSRDQIHHRVFQALSEVGLPAPAAIAAAYPHQLSGGMQQRALIAAALIGDPELLLLDEPTTALDVTVEAQILDLLEKLRAQRRLTMLFISHNMGVVARIADRICVLYAGEILELGPMRSVLAQSAHPYTKGLLASMPKLAAEPMLTRLPAIPGSFPESTIKGCIFKPRCPLAEGRCSESQVMIKLDAGHSAKCWKVDQTSAAEIFGTPVLASPKFENRANTILVKVVDLKKVYRGAHTQTTWRRIGGVLPWPTFQVRQTSALDGISLDIRRGQVVGVVGESGSGKSTLGRAMLRLVDVDAGEIHFDSVDVTNAKERDLRTFRKRAQIIFQNPHSSLNPRMRVGAAITRRVWLHSGKSAALCQQRARELLERVGLGATFYDRFPHQLSGGEKQRVGIARALASDPELIVCDEPVSALDVSVQATVLNLLADLRSQLGLSYLFISHDVSVVACLSDRVVVMFAGRICEEGRTSAVLVPPYHPYTEALLSAVPGVELAHAQTPRVEARATQSWNGLGCPFHLRCPRKLGRVCEDVRPALTDDGNGHRIACHIPTADLDSLQFPVLETRRISLKAIV